MFEPIGRNPTGQRCLRICNRKAARASHARTAAFAWGLSHNRLFGRYPVHSARWNRVLCISSQQSHKEYDANNLGVVVVRTPQVSRQHAGAGHARTQRDRGGGRRAQVKHLLAGCDLQVASQRQIDTHPRGFGIR